MPSTVAAMVTTACQTQRWPCGPIMHALKSYRAVKVRDAKHSTFYDSNENFHLFSAESKKYTPNTRLNQKIAVFTGDITTLEIDCIVNAANKYLLGGLSSVYLLSAVCATYIVGYTISTLNLIFSNRVRNILFL